MYKIDLTEKTTNTSSTKILAIAIFFDENFNAAISNVRLNRKATGNNILKKLISGKKYIPNVMIENNNAQILNRGLLYDFWLNVFIFFKVFIRTY